MLVSKWCVFQNVIKKVGIPYHLQNTGILSVDAFIFHKSVCRVDMLFFRFFIRLVLSDVLKIFCGLFGSGMGIQYSVIPPSETESVFFFLRVMAKSG